MPYKTLLLSTADTVQHVIKEAMEKYGVDTDDASQFVLVEVLYTVFSLKYVSYIMRKYLFKVFKQVRHKPGCTAKEDG